MRLNMTNWPLGAQLGPSSCQPSVRMRAPPPDGLMTPMLKLPAMRVKANIPFAVAITWISNPLTNVPIWVSQLWLGNQVQGLLHLSPPEFAGEFKIPGVGLVNAATFMLGVLMSGLILALLAFPIVHLFSAIMPHHLPKITRRHRDTVVIVPPRGSRSSGS